MGGQRQKKKQRMNQLKDLMGIHPPKSDPKLEEDKPTNGSAMVPHKNGRQRRRKYCESGEQRKSTNMTVWESLTKS